MPGSIHRSMYGPGSVRGSVYGSVYGDRSMAWSEASLGSMSAMLHAADLQQRTSIKMLHNIRRQAEAEADRQLHFAEKAAARESHLAAFEAAKEEERRRQAEDAAAMEEHRRARAEAAARDEMAVRQAALRKVMAVEERADEFAAERAAAAQRTAEHNAKVAAKRESAYHAALEAEEAKRASFKARQDAADRIMREKEELRRLENTIKDEQAFLRQEARTAAKERAEAELAHRTASYRRKHHHKDANLQTWYKQANNVKQLKAQEARARAEYITLQARSAAEADAAHRNQIRAVAQSKAYRVEAIVAEREALAERLQRLRHSMVQQEQAVRHSLDNLRRRGTSFTIPSIGDGTSSVVGYPASVISHALTSRSRLAQSVISNGRRAGGSVRSRPQSAATASRRIATAAADAAAGAGPDGTTFKRVRPMSASAVLRAGAAAAAAAGLANALPHPDVILSKAQSKAHAAALSKAHTEANMGYSTMGVQGPDALSRREEELRHVLREEIDKETERQAILAGTSDTKEAQRLAIIFAAEREEAKKRILQLSAAVHAAASAAAAATITPRTVAPGETGEPASHKFLTPQSPGTPQPTAPSFRAPLSPSDLAPMHPGLPGSGVVSSITGFIPVQLETSVAVPHYTIPASHMQHPVQPHHNHMSRRVPLLA